MSTHIGILFIGTGRYISLFDGFYESFSDFFCPDIEKTFFVFSDQIPNIQASNIKHLPTPHEPWPLPTLNRFDYFLRNARAISACSHLIFANSNLRPLVHVDFEEFFDGENELFGTKHPGFAFQKKKWHQKNPGTFENNKKSTAYAGRNPKTYFAGGLNGGTTEAWLRLCGYLSDNIQQDKKNKINGSGWAIWHDESQINHYFNCRATPKIIGPEYLYPEGWELPVEKKIIILDKSKIGGHDYLRGIKN